MLPHLHVDASVSAVKAQTPAPDDERAFRVARPSLSLFAQSKSGSRFAVRITRHRSREHRPSLLHLDAARG